MPVYTDLKMRKQHLEDIIVERLLTEQYDVYPFMPKAMDTYTTGTGSVIRQANNAQLRTGTTAGSIAQITGNLWQTFARMLFKFDKRVRFVCYARFATNTLQTVYICGGNIGTGADENGFGFRIEGARIYAFCNNNGTTTSVDTGKDIATGTNYRFEGRLIPGVKAEFYLNDELIAVMTTGLPTGYTDLPSFARITNLEAVNKVVGIGTPLVVAGRHV